MKSLLLRYVFVLLCIVAIIGGALLAGGAFWGRLLVRRHYAPVLEPSIHLLAEQLSQVPLNRAKLTTTLEDLTRHSDIVMWSVVHGNDEFTVCQGPKKREKIISILHLSYPLVYGGKPVGALKIWPSPEFIFEELLEYRNIAALCIAAAVGVVLAAIVLFYYLWWAMVVPLRKVDEFITHLEKDENVPLDFGKRHKSWGKLTERLNRITEKVTDNATTLTMLFSVSQTLTSHTDINDVFGLIAKVIHEKFSDEYCAMLLMGEDGYLRIAGQRGLSPEFARSVHLRPGEEFAGKAFETCRPAVVNDCSLANADRMATPLQGEGIGSCTHLPLIIDEKCIGVLSVGAGEPRYFTQERVTKLATMAKYLSIALRNARLYEHVQELNHRLETEVSSTTHELLQTNSRLIQKVREMKLLSDIAAFAGSKVNLSDILEMIVEKIKDLLQTQSAGFFLYSEATHEVAPHAPFFGIKDQDFSKLRFRLDEVALIEHVIREGKSAVFESELGKPPEFPLLQNIISLHSLALVPLRSGKKIVGVFGVANKYNGSFTHDDVRLLELIADRVAVIIENVRLYEELELRVRDLTTLREISLAISSEPVWGVTLKKIIAAAQPAFDADLCALLIYDEHTKELVTQPGAHFTGGDEAVLLRIPLDDPHSVSAQVFRSGEAFLSPDASIDIRIKSQTAKLWDVRSLILVPLKAENRLIGVLRIGKHKANCYGDEHLRLATLIAHQAAIIIENSHLYESLREAKGELEELNKIKNEFISMVSHELRTPITAIKGFVKVVLEGETGTLNEQQEKFLRIADQSIDRLTVLVSDLLDISRIESGQFKLRLTPIDPREAITDAVKNLAGEAGKKKLNIDAKLPKHFPLVFADRVRLIQVFNNLILNAIKFTPEGGGITVSAEDKGDLALFSVADTGIGIISKDHEKIFEKFYQVDSSLTRSTTGTGLGLAIVKSIVEMHGGHVWVESEPGRGSNFRFVIPRAKMEIKDFRRDLPSEVPSEGTSEGTSEETTLPGS